MAFKSDLYTREEIDSVEMPHLPIRIQCADWNGVLSECVWRAHLKQPG